MDGEFICEDKVGVAKGVAGGNFLILASDQVSGLSAAERAVDEIAKLPNVICPFPGGVVRSGSKVGARYQAVGEAIAVGIRSAAGAGVVSISAANYGGKLGKHHYNLQELLSKNDASQNGQSYPQRVR